MFNKPQSFQFIMDLAVAFPYYLHDDHQLPHTYSPYFSHDYIDYFAILPHEWLLSLPPISIQANPNFGDRPSGPNHHDIYREGANQVREIPLEDALDSEERNGDFCLEPPLEQTIEPWKLILLYCTEPDWQLDCDLNLHWTQKLTKGSHGLRHMTFSLAGIRIGWLKESFLYYYSAAKKSLGIGKPILGMAICGSSNPLFGRFRCIRSILKLFHINYFTRLLAKLKIFSKNWLQCIMVMKFMPNIDSELNFFRINRI